MRIADFGLATFISENSNEKLKFRCGTPTYMAPEILRNQGYREKVDIFSVGSIFFNLISGHYLFNTDDPSQLMALNQECDLSQISTYI